MYGDLVTAVAAVVFIPTYWYLCLVEERENFPGAFAVTISATVTSALSWISWKKSDINASLAAVVGHAVMLIIGFHSHWPAYGKSVVFPSLMWMLVRSSVNFSLPFSYKLVSGMIALFATVATSPPHHRVIQSLPAYLGVTVVYCTFHYCAEQQQTGKQHAVSARTASILLAGTLAYHFSYELNRILTSPEKVLEGSYSMVQAAFFASFGLAAAGAFSDQVDISEALEAKVQERTKEIVKQARELRIIGVALEASDTAIAIVDPEQRIEWSNPAMKDLLPEEKLQANCTLLQSLSLSEKSTQALEHAFNPAKETENEIEIQSCFYRLYTAPVPVDDNGAELSRRTSSTDADASSLRYIVALKNVTAQREKQNSEKKAQKEELLKNAMLNSMEALSHEIRTPLQGIVGMTSLLVDADNLSIKEAKDGLAMVMVSSRMLLTLINNLLDVRKCDDSLLNGFQLSSVPLAKSLQEATDFCRPIASVTNVNISAHVGDDCKHVMVRSNPVRFQQVLVNLVSNGIKYTKAGSSVRISATVMTMKEANELMEKALECGLPIKKQARGDELSLGTGGGETKDAAESPSLVAVVSVCDTGDGVSCAGKVFQRFSESTTTRSINVIGQNAVAQPTGTGLGLNLCVKFIERMHGNIWVANNPNGGARFSFYLPVIEGESEPVVGTSAPLTPFSSDAPLPPVNGEATAFSTDATVNKNEYRILVVDDTIINLKVMERMLRRIGFQHVSFLDSGMKALEFLAHTPVDLVLTDIQMPYMSGHELSEQIMRRSQHLASSPLVVAMTAETSERLYEQCRLSGIVHVLHKPITAVELESFFSHTVSTLAENPT